MTVSPTCGTTSGLVRTSASQLSSILINGSLTSQSSLYDTAGIVSVAQLCPLFSYKELTYFWPTEQMTLRKIFRKQGHSLFIGGFVRIDILNNDKEVDLNVYSSRKLPLNPLRTSKCESIMSGTENRSNFYPPLQSKTKSWNFSPLKEVGLFAVKGGHDSMIVISGAGWFTVGGSCTLRIWSPSGIGINIINTQFVNSKLL